MKLLLKIMYDGTRYAGYQAQTDFPSVQTTLTDAVGECFGFPCNVTGCSRTDAGVHALGFVCTVEPKEDRGGDWLTVPVGRVHRALSKYLPDDISVCGEAAVGDGFHPRYSVKRKTYIYKMYDTPFSDPFYENRAWHLKHSLTDEDIRKMNAGGAHLIGRHDFTSFMASGSKITDAVREIYSLRIERGGDGLVTLTVSADGFLYNMVRIITGTLADVAAGTIQPDEIGAVLLAKDRTKAGRTAPACGLYLADVDYGEEISWKCE